MPRFYRLADSLTLFFFVSWLGAIPHSAAFLVSPTSSNGPRRHDGAPTDASSGQSSAFDESFTLYPNHNNYHQPRSSSLSLRRPPTTSTRLSAAKCRQGLLEVPRTILNDNGDEPTTQYFNISYQIHRPMALSSRQAAPLLVLHGGPSVPSDYLRPLVNVVPYRSIIFYDQLGCGQSDEPRDAEAYSIELAVDDLERLVAHLSLRQFHLLGQSFGGILGYEFLKRRAMRDNDDKKDSSECLSFVMSSTPTSVPLVEAEVETLLTDLMMNLKQQQQQQQQGPIDGMDSSLNNLETRFQQTHICRTSSPDGQLPQPLQDAYAKAGTVWRGSEVIADYVAQPLPFDDATDTSMTLPSLLCLRGEYDFVTPACIRDWQQVMWKNQRRRVREVELPGTSHHGLLENGAQFGDVVESYLAEYDP